PISRPRPRPAPARQRLLRPRPVRPGPSPGRRPPTAASNAAAGFPRARAGVRPALPEWARSLLQPSVFPGAGAHYAMKDKHGGKVRNHAIGGAIRRRTPRARMRQIHHTTSAPVTLNPTTRANATHG